MGKEIDQQLRSSQQRFRGGTDTGNISRECSRGFSGIFGFKCSVVSLFGVAAFISAIFWLLPVGLKEHGFEAATSIKLRAVAQSSFNLPKPVSGILPYVSLLEYDINEEIGVPSLQVAVLSIHKMHSSNMTTVVFGLLVENTSNSMSRLALSLLKSSFIDIFLQKCNLTLSASVFGEPSSFEILKFPGGITIIPEPAAIMSMPLFSFSLGQSISDLTKHLSEFKEQLHFGLHLNPSEAVYVQTTNIHGSTEESQISVELLAASELGTILPERLIQIAQLITGSTKKNLGLDGSIFGEVKGVSLSSILSHSSPSPAPVFPPWPAEEHHHCSSFPSY